MVIHESAEDYLESILIIQEQSGQVRSIDIVNRLGFSKPSVSIAMKKLRESGYMAAIRRSPACSRCWASPRSRRLSTPVRWSTTSARKPSEKSVSSSRTRDCARSPVEIRVRQFPSKALWRRFRHFL